MMEFRSEREVEINLLAPLFQRVLGYHESDLEWAKPVKMTLGREIRTKQADLVITRAKRPLITVEAKRPTEPVQSGLDQVDSYAFALKTPYSVITNGKQLVLRGYYSFNSRINVIDESVNDLEADGWKKLRGLIAFDRILESIKEPSNPVKKPDEDLVKDYRRFFKRIHNAIRDSDKLDPAAAFDELSKLLFLKAAEDEWQSGGAGQAKPVLTAEMIDQWEALGKGKSSSYVNEWFGTAIMNLFPGVAGDRPKLELSPQALKTVLPMMRPFHVKGGDVDVKGRAFEEFLPSQLRGKGLGQFFTPRPIVDFMANLADISIQDVIVDFACGSGGFLIKAFEQMQNELDQLPSGTFTRIGTSREKLLDDVKAGQLFGIDAEPRAARTAKMNMLMWGDGRRVFRGNGLASIDYNGDPYPIQNYDRSIPGSGCTLIMANPPFGSKEKDRGILDQYTLGSRHKAKSSEKTEVLFVEKGLNLLRPEGRMLIVLPQGLLSAKSYSNVRNLILSQAEIRAIISLPTHTFVQSGVPTVNTTILYVQKFTDQKRDLFEERHGHLSLDEISSSIKSDPDFDHSIFMGTAEFIGYEPSGRPIGDPDEETDLDSLLRDFHAPSELDFASVDLFEFASRHYGERSFRRRDQVVRGTTRGLKTAFRINLSATDDRLDPPFYLFRAHAMPFLKAIPPLGSSLIERKGQFKPQTDEELDDKYSILSVSTDGGITLSDTISGEDITQRYKRVKKGDIAYNPMRANIGSFGVVPDHLDGGLISPDYFVVQSNKVDPNYLVALLKTPFFRMYVDVVSTGSIRDRLYPEDFRALRIPRPSASQQTSLSEISRRIDQEIGEAAKRMAGERSAMYARVRDFVLTQAEEGSTDLSERFFALISEWERETGRFSSVKQKTQHPTYQAIIQMGSPAVPLILKKLTEAPAHWFQALSAITNADPVSPEERSSVAASAKAWLEWGKREGVYTEDA